jgi:hypothetical protein
VNSQSDPLVIHDGMLIPSSQARPLLITELIQHGYQLAEVDQVLSRAIRATQLLLFTLAGLPEPVREAKLALALLADRRAAEQWRALWTARQEGERKQRLQRQFEHWQKSNDQIDEYNQAAPLRAAERKRLDEERMRTLMSHIAWKQRRRRRRGFEENQCRLNNLTDHEYIEWMFACGEHG